MVRSGRGDSGVPGKTPMSYRIIGWTLIGVLLLAGTAGAMSSTHYNLNWDLFSGGGGGSSSSHYKLQGSIGVTGGYASSTHYQLQGGFWGGLSTKIFDAQVISDTIPATMNGGQSSSVTVTMKNTGRITWSTSNGIQLGGVGGQAGDAAKFGPIRIPVPAGTTVAPGQACTFSFTMTAPATTGTYNPRYQMVLANQWFGQTDAKTITVSSGGATTAEVSATTAEVSATTAEVSTNTAEISAGYIPATMTHGKTYSVYVTMKNTGTTTWSAADGIALGGVGDQAGDAAKFGPTRIPVPSGTTVAPGQTYRFLFTMTAPVTPGTYNPRYQMVTGGQAWFGAILSKTVTVK